MTGTGHPLPADQITPGPWELDSHPVPGAGPHPDFPDLHYVNIRSAGYYAVAPHGLSLTGYVRPADARLLVAAPELLEALKALHASYIKCAPFANIVAQQARDAIAKAEGKL